jgi:hypothetical protein
LNLFRKLDFSRSVFRPWKSASLAAEAVVIMARSLSRCIISYGGRSRTVSLLQRLCATLMLRCGHVLPMPAQDSIMKAFQPAKRRGRCIDAGRTKRTYNTVSQRFPFPNQEIKRKLPLYVVGNKRSLMIESQIRLRLHMGTTLGVSRVFMDGGLDAQTIRLEGNIVSRTAGVHSIIPRNAGPE